MDSTNLPDAVRCIAALADGKSVRVILGDTVYDLPYVPPEVKQEPPVNPLAVIEQTVSDVKDALLAVHQGQSEIVKELRKPVIPKYDGKGKFISAQRGE